MSADEAGFDAAAASEDLAFQPSAALRARLLWGIVGISASGVIGIASMLAMDLQAKGWTLSTVLDLASVVPLVLVLWSYLRLAKEVGSIGLRRGSLGMLGAFGLISVLSLADAVLIGDAGVIVVYILVAALVVSLIVAISHRPGWANATAGEGDSTAAKASWGGAGTLAIIGYIGAKLLVRGRKGLFNFLGDEWPTVLLVLALMILFVVFTIVAGVVQLRLGRRLGLTSVLLGLVELGIPVLVLVLLGVFFADAVVALEAAGPEEADAEAAMETLALQWWSTLLKVGISVQALWTILTVLFFWTVRGSADPEPEALMQM